MKILILKRPKFKLAWQTANLPFYGNLTFDQFFENSEKKICKMLNELFSKANIEGEIINKLHEVGFSFDGIILNAGAYTHTSIAIGDAIKGIETPVIEVHISNVYAREEFRHVSYIAPNAKGIIAGFGLQSYELALEKFYLKFGRYPLGQAIAARFF